MEISWQQFYSGQFPSKIESKDIYTHFILIALRKSFQPGSDFLGAFMKWGIDFAKDLAAMECFTNCKNNECSDAEAYQIAGEALKQTDWDLIQKLCETGAADYVAYCHRNRDGDKIEPYLAGLQYALTMKELPGVQEPGDLYKRMTEA
jgi:hypothetical protein